LPADQRRALRTAYCFFRTLDDWVDAGQVTGEDLDRYCTIASRAAREQTDPVLMAWADTRERYRVDPRLIQQLIDGIKLDLQPVRLATLADLDHYCYQVAAVPALMILPILGTARGISLETARPYAVRLAQALQVTDILVDVVEDWQRGRRYIPAELLTEHRADEKPLTSGVATAGWRAAMRALVARTRQAYRAAWPGIRMLAPAGRWAVGLGSLSLQVYLDALERRNYDNVSSPIEVGRARRLAYALGRVGMVLG
jgi:phytoene synthase